MEKILIPIRKYRGSDQDSTEWLNEFNVATQANGITNARKIQIVRGYCYRSNINFFNSVISEIKIFDQSNI
jgi:hypothetical protein